MPVSEGAFRLEPKRPGGRRNRNLPYKDQDQPPRRDWFLPLEHEAIAKAIAVLAHMRRGAGWDGRVAVLGGIGREDVRVVDLFVAHGGPD